MLKHTAPPVVGRAVRLPPRPSMPLNAATLHGNYDVLHAGVTSSPCSYNLAPPKLANGSARSPQHGGQGGSYVGSSHGHALHGPLHMQGPPNGVREALTSLGLLCLVSLLLALLSLIFLLKISPGGRDLPPPPPQANGASPDDYVIVYDVTLALCALSLSLNLCCLLVCAIQFLFAVKLVRATVANTRGNKYLQKSSASRVCAVGGFFVSIPVFLTGIILYTFTQFHSTPAIVTSVLIGIGILFCGGAMVHNVFVWQREKTISVRPTCNTTILTPISNHAPYLNHSRANLSDNGASFNQSGVNLNQTVPQLYQNTSQLANVNHSHHSHVTPNISHISFGGAMAPHNYIRAATATPPTPKITGIVTREASGSISPGVAGPSTAVNLDLSSGDLTGSPHHELSTLV